MISFMEKNIFLTHFSLIFYSLTMNKWQFLVENEKKIYQRNNNNFILYKYLKKAITQYISTSHAILGCYVNL